MAKDTDDQTQEREDAAAGLDMSQAAVKKMIAEARVRGYITYDQLNQVLPPEQVASEQIEDVMSMLSEMGINIIEEEEAEDDGTSKDLVEAGGPKAVELLSREGEIAIAKRIEAGRNTMISGLCESPLTFQAITIWRDELLSEDILLRDVIDLETTFGNQLEEDGEETESVTATPTAAAPGAETKTEEKQELDADGNPIANDDDEDDEDEQANMSLAAMEAALKPRVLETLDNIAAMNSIPVGSTASPPRPAVAGPRSLNAPARRSKTCAPRWPKWANMSASTLLSSAASCSRSRRAKKRPVRPRKRWSKPTCAS